MVYLCTKFEDSTFSFSKDMKKDPKRKNWGQFRVMGVTHGHWESVYDFVFAFYRNYASIWYHVSRYSELFCRKSQIFPSPRVHLAPCWGNHIEISPSSTVSENYSPWQLRGVVCVILHLAVLIELRLVTDGRRDRRTARDTGPSVYRASIASRGKTAYCRNLITFKLWTCCVFHVTEVVNRMQKSQLNFVPSSWPSPSQTDNTISQWNTVAVSVAL